jgi:hypothetical protein
MRREMRILKMLDQKDDFISLSGIKREYPGSTK